MISNWFKKNNNNIIELNAPIKGKAIPLDEVEDPTFSQLILGKGGAILPSDGTVYAPCNGIIQSIFDTNHALVIFADNGAEILIHVGFDTVKLKGKGYTSYVENNQKVKKGDKLIFADLEQIKKDGYNTTTVMIICNTDEYNDVTAVMNEDVDINNVLVKITKK